jgi:hypothetical protein
MSMIGHDAVPLFRQGLPICILLDDQSVHRSREAK